MAEPNKAENKAAGSSAIRRIVTIGLVVLVPACLGLAVFNFVVRPMLAAQAAPPPPPNPDALSPEVATFEFPETQATVLSDDPGQANPMVMYQFVLVCKDAATHELVTGRSAFFNARLNELMRNRTRSELNDPFVQAAILKQALQKANAELKKFDAAGTLEILEVLMPKLAVYDL